MAWIESHQELGRHPKTRRMARLLGIGLPQAVGHLHFLWWWALEFAQDGDLSRFDAADIADAAMWDGDPEQFVSALINAGTDGPGFIEEREGGGLVLHDWIQYAGRLVEKRRADAERKRQARKGNGRPADVQRTHIGQRKESIRNPNLNQEEEEERPRTHAHEDSAPAVAEPQGQPWFRWFEERTSTPIANSPQFKAICDLQQRGVTDALIIAVIEKAIAEKTRVPLNYALRILGNLALYGVTTPEEWEAWEREHAAAEEDRQKATTHRRARSPTQEQRVVHRIDEFDFSDFDEGG